MRMHAEISPCGLYRYLLSRVWDEAGPVLAFIMLNPSTADSMKDDPTLRRCIHFAKSWGYGSLLVGNLYALRSSDPRELTRHVDPVGPDNDRWLKKIAHDAHQTVVAWGAHPMALRRDMRVMELPWKNVCALKLTAKGDPMHPLARGRNRIPNDATGVPFVYDGSCI